MNYFELVLKGLQLAAATASAAAAAKETYNALREAAQQSGELTPEQSQDLDQKAAAIFAAPESQPSGR